MQYVIYVSVRLTTKTSGKDEPGAGIGEGELVGDLRHAMITYTSIFGVIRLSGLPLRIGSRSWPKAKKKSFHALEFVKPCQQNKNSKSPSSVTPDGDRQL